MDRDRKPTAEEIIEQGEGPEELERARAYWRKADRRAKWRKRCFWIGVVLLVLAAMTLGLLLRD